MSSLLFPWLDTNRKRNKIYFNFECHIAMCMDVLWTWDMLFCTRLALLHSILFFVSKSDLPLIIVSALVFFHNLLSGLWSTFHDNICNRWNVATHSYIWCNIRTSFKLYLSFYGSSNFDVFVVMQSTVNESSIPTSKREIIDFQIND